MLPNIHRLEFVGQLSHDIAALFVVLEHLVDVLTLLLRQLFGFELLQSLKLGLLGACESFGDY